MRKSSNSILYLIFIGLVLFVVFKAMMPSFDSQEPLPLTAFSTTRALEKVKALTVRPHYVGSQNHTTITNSLVKELQLLGLQPQIQEGFTLSEGGTLVKAKNIMARIKGSNNSKALVLLSHYDSAPHSKSFGASDDASGMATILESLRAFQASKQQPKNDIIVLFTDAEELGLNGAALFVTQHNWVKEVGLVLNFEARGTSGPSYMLMETNDGNAKMVEAFANGKVNYPVSNSLMYSIYKMLPNDTDLTVFREKGKIQGFNFAFIDNHFNYHTAQDNYKNLSANSLAHQGSYLLPLLHYFSNANLTDLNSNLDKVYFTIPYTFVNYPFEWIKPMFVFVILFLAFIIFIGINKYVLRPSDMLKAFLPFLCALVASALITFFGWQLLLKYYPQYHDIQQGFTYNGHDYIYGFVSLTLAICFLCYSSVDKKYIEFNQIIAPLFFWIICNAGIIWQLKGASFLIIPVLASTSMLGIYVLTQKSYLLFNMILALPTLFILPPFIEMFPVGLGLKILVGSAIFTVLTFGLLLPIFGSFSKKKAWSGLFFLVAIAFFWKAHQASNYEVGKAKPNSLIYALNGDDHKAYWLTYDTNLDEWTKSYLGDKPTLALDLNKNKLYSKYNLDFTFKAPAPVKNLKKPTIDFVKDSIIGSNRYLKIVITPNRNVNRYTVFSNGTSIHNFQANGVKAIDFKSNISAKGQNKLVTYYVTANFPLTMEFSIPSNQQLDLELNESSFDLLENPLFSIPKRKDWMMPLPFVLNDAIMITQKIKPTLKTENTKALKTIINATN